MKYCSWQDMRRTGVAALIGRGLGNTQGLVLKDCSWESLKEEVKGIHWPQIQLLLVPADIQEKTPLNTKDILEKIPRILYFHRLLWKLLLMSTVIPISKVCAFVVSVYKEKFLFVFLFVCFSLFNKIPY